MTPDLFAAGQKPAAEKPAKKPRKAAAEAPRAVEPDEVLPAGSAEARAELIVSEARANPVALFTDEKRYSEFYEKIAAEVRGFVPDLSTDKGRKAVASLAFRVTKAKTSLEKAGLGLTEGWRQQIALVNASRKKMTEELDSLQKEVRAPLTAWEEAEKERVANASAEIDRIRSAAAIGDEETAAEVEARGRALMAETLDPALFGDLLPEAQAAQATSVNALAQAMHRLRKAEADAAELEALRKEKEERERKAEQEAAARALAPSVVQFQASIDPEAEAVRASIISEGLKEHELPAALESVLAEACAPLWADHLRQRAEAKAAEERRQREAEEARQAELKAAAEKAAQEARDEAEAAAQKTRDEEAARIAAEREAEEKKRREEEEAKEAKRIADQAERDRAHEAELAAARKAREDAETAAKAAKDAADAAEAKRLQEAADAEAKRKAEADAQAAREKDQKHRKAIAGEAAAAILEIVSDHFSETISDEPPAADAVKLAQAIVVAIAAKNIPHVSIQF